MPSANLTVKQLIDAGAHFGHLKARSHPRARQFAYEVRDRIVLINLDKTLEQLKSAQQFCFDAAKNSKNFLLVGTKKLIQENTKVAGEKAKLAYVNNKWFAGTLTNFDEIIKNIRKLQNFKEQLEKQSSLTKREKLKISQKIEKLEKNLSGLKDINRLPDVIILIDANHEKIALSEAKMLGIPVVAISDSNVDPNLIDYLIFANDDSRQTVELILNELIKAVTDGAKKQKPKNEPSQNN